MTARMFLRVPTCIGLLASLAAAQPPASAPSASAPSAARSFTVEQLQQDLDELARQLPKRHISPFTRVTREQFEAAVATLRERLPELRGTALAVEFLKLVAMIGDAHTTIDVSPLSAPARFLPFNTTVRADGVMVTSATAPHAELVGSALVRIGDTPARQAIDRLAAVYPWENESWKLHLSRQWLVRADVLHALGVLNSPDRATCTFRDADGQERTVELESFNGKQEFRAPGRTLVGPAALSMKATSDWYWFEVIPDTAVLYVRYDRCAEQPDRPLAEFFAKVLERLDQGGIERVVIDLRANTGGNSALLVPLVLKLAQREELRRPGAVVGLISRATFSSAQLNAKNIKDSLGAVLIGLPTGQKPNAFGEQRTFKLPNTGMTVTYSTKRFVTDPADPPSMMPDVLIDPTIADYHAGRDPTLEAAIAYAPK